MLILRNCLARIATGLTLFLVLMSGRAHADSQPLAFSGVCTGYAVNGTVYADGSSPCKDAFYIHVPDAAQRAKGQQPSLQFQSQAAGAPVLLLELSRARQEGVTTTTNDIISFDVRAVRGASVLTPPGLRLTCKYIYADPKYSSMPSAITVPDVRCGFEGAGYGDAEHAYDVLRFGFMPSHERLPQFRTAIMQLHAALSGGVAWVPSEQRTGTRKVVAAGTGGLQPLKPPVAAPAAAVPAPKAASAAVVFKPSSSPHAIFGLLVGTQWPDNPPLCNERSLIDQPSMPKTVPYCLSRSESGLAALLGNVTNDVLTLEDMKVLQLAQLSLIINDQMYDTRIADSVLITIDRNRIIQKVHILTRPYVATREAVMKMLNGKYGRFVRQDSTEWVNTQTGQLLERTPNYYWNKPGFYVDYFSRTPGILNTKTAMGGILLYTPAYSRMLADHARRKDAAPAGRKPM